MLTLNGVNFVSENTSLLRCLFSKSVFFPFVFHTTPEKKKKLPRNLWHHKIFSAERRMLLRSISEFTGSRMFAGMNNETPALLQYTRETDISAAELSKYTCQTLQTLF